MQSAPIAGPGQAELIQIVDSVFASMLGMEVTASEAAFAPGDDRISSVVNLSGTWNGALLFECTTSQARLFAGRCMSAGTPDTVDDNVRDALGEIANMIGGNLKSVLYPGIQLSMPAVIDGAEYSLRLCGAAMLERLSFQCTGGVFRVSLLSTPDAV